MQTKAIYQCEKRENIVKYIFLKKQKHLNKTTRQKKTSRKKIEKILKEKNCILQKLRLLLFISISYCDTYILLLHWNAARLSGLRTINVNLSGRT